MDSITCEMCGQMRAPLTGGSSGGGFVDAAEEKRRQIITKQLANKAAIDAEVVGHFKDQEEHRGLVAHAFECACCFDDVEEYTGIRCAPEHTECEHMICTRCFARLVEGQLERKEPVVCPLCPASRPAHIPSWLVGLVVGEQAQTKLIEIEQLHLAQAGGGTLRLWQCPTPDCQNRLALDPNWDARIAAKRQALGVGLTKPAQQLVFLPSQATALPPANPHQRQENFWGQVRAPHQALVPNVVNMMPHYVRAPPRANPHLRQDNFWGQVRAPHQALVPNAVNMMPHYVRAPPRANPHQRQDNLRAQVRAPLQAQAPTAFSMMPQKVPDSAFTASSQRDSHLACCARLHHSAGWLPLGETSGWLELDLGEDQRLVGLTVQGGFLGTVSSRPSGDIATTDWTRCSYIVPNLEKPSRGTVDIDFSPLVARFLRFDAERFVDEVGLRFEVYITDAPEGIDPLTEQERLVGCSACKKKICIRCNVEEHAGFTCEAFQLWKVENESGDRAYVDMVAKGLIKPCPNCAAPILKNEGCNFMSCPTCNDPDRMCWQTGKKRYGPHGCGGGHNCH